MKLTYNGKIDTYEVERREGRALLLRIGINSAEEPLISDVAGSTGQWKLPSTVEIIFHSWENEIAERLWMLKGQDGLAITLNVEAPDGSL